MPSFKRKFERAHSGLPAKLSGSLVVVAQADSRGPREQWKWSPWLAPNARSSPQV